MDRITFTSTSRSSLADLQRSSRLLSETQSRVSSGRKYQRPSDAPAEAIASLDYRARAQRNDQLDRNASDARTWLDAADTALTDVTGRLTAARTLMVQGNNATLDAQSRRAVAAELRSIRAELVGLANTQHRGRPIFGGTTASVTAYDPTGAYLGDSGVVERLVSPQVTVSVNRVGPDVFGTRDLVSPLDGDVFQVLDELANAVEAGDITTAQTGMDRLDRAIDRVEVSQVELGSRAKQVEEVQLRHQRVSLELKRSLSDVEDVDLAEAMVELKTREIAFQTALGATANVLRVSLLDFLR